MKNFSLNALLPHIIAVAVFLIITLIFFHPVVFEGKVMTQNDVIQGVSAGQEVKEFREETGQEALWTNSMFGGMPAYLINVQWSGDLTKYLHDLMSLYLPSPARYALLAMLCFYILLLTHRVNPYLAMIGGIAYGLNSFNMVSIEAGHIWKVSAISYMPLVLAGVQLIIRKKILPGVGMTAAAVALVIRSNHIQIAYYLFLILLVFWIVYLVDAARNKDLAGYARTTLFIALAGLLGVSTNFGKLWTSAEYSPYTIRGKSELQSNTQSTSGGLDRDYAFAWSNGITESFTFLTPYFYGGASGENVGTKSRLAKDLRKAGVNPAQIRSISSRIPTYWGDQPFTSGPIYPGIIAMFLFVVGILTCKGPLRSWLIAATILGFMLSWGKNFSSFNYLMFDYFPLYNKFRAVSMTLVIPLLCIPLLGFVGLSEFIKKADKRTLYKAVGVVGGLLVLFLISSSFLSFKSPNDTAIGQQVFLDAIMNQRKSMFQSSTIRSLFFLLSAAGMLLLLIREKISMTVFMGVLGLLTFLDLFLIDRKYVDKDKFSERSQIALYQPDEADQRIRQDGSHYRVLNLTVDVFNNATTSFHHSSVGGYHGAKMRRYNDLIGYHLNGEIQGAVAQIQDGSYALADIPVLNMLNTKYFKLSNTANAVLTNRSALGNAWFVTEIRKADSPDIAIASLQTVGLDTVAVSENLENQTGLSNGLIALIDYAPNYLKYQTNNEGDGFAVFSEIFYDKGWRAYIDGEEATIERVNYVLRGLHVPAGDHVIEFRFKPTSYFVGNAIMWIGSLLTLGLLLFAGYQEYRKSPSN